MSYSALTQTKLHRRRFRRQSAEPVSNYYWSGIWDGIKDIEFGREPYQWRFYNILLNGYDLKNKKIIEIGCGTGINSIFMGLKGARITLLDQTREALDIAKKTLDKFSIDAELLCGNAFEFDLRGFDLSHSEGVIEHFLKKERQEIVNIHARAVKRGGKVLIIVPNMRSAPYRIGKYIAERIGTWKWGGEYPYSASELKQRMGKAGLKTGEIIGGEFLFSFGWLLTGLWASGNSTLKRTINLPAREKLVKLNYNNFFANRWGRVIGCVGGKK